MRLNPAVFDAWLFRRTATDVEYLLLQTSELKAARYFNGGRFWLIPSGVFLEGESVLDALDRKLATHQLVARGIWAAEHAYTIYNRRFEEMQIISASPSKSSAIDRTSIPSSMAPTAGNHTMPRWRWCTIAA